MTPEERAGRIQLSRMRDTMDVHADIVAAIREAVAEEREACANLVESFCYPFPVAASKIRARTATP